MKTKKQIKQFILDTLLPYRNDTSLCGYSDGNECVYHTKDGRMCAVGKHLRNPKQFAEYIGDFYDLLSENDVTAECILTDEAYSMDFSTGQWLKIQQYHDSIAENGVSANLNLENRVASLELAFGITLDELR